ncbi:lipopolysaccharide biosynthesis protein [Adlercreutzia sp. ZJ154]|uniref:lipopolysaccharide biosynthesis protein n=1 Tax=Adlercreutzia sp. ZJ154 TaxID=2709790 RepID=UPI0013ED41D6|nr:oligosaccharide flippase family protein [Adlercreutzia sp. ZJ154]
MSFTKKITPSAVPKGVKASIVFVFASVCSQGMAIVSLPIFTRLLTTEQMGIVTTYNTWLNLIGIITTLGLTSGSFNIAMMKFEDSRAQYTSSALALSLAPSAILVLLSIPFGELFSEWLDISVPLVRCMCVMLLLNPALNLWLMRQRYEYRYVAVFLVTVLNSVAGTLVAIVMVVWASSSDVVQLTEVRILSSSCVTGLIAVVIGSGIFVSGRTLFNKRFWQFALKTGTPLVIHSVAKYVLDASDRILIGIFVGSAAVGIYGVLYSLSSISLVFWSAINSALIPFIFESLKRGEEDNVRSVAVPLLTAYAVVCLVLMLLAPEIVYLLTTKSYVEAVYLVPPIASGIFFTSLYNLYSNLILYKERTSYVMWATVVAATVNILLNVLSLPVFGYIAAAYATLISCCLLAFLQFLFSKKLEISNALNNRFNLLLSFGVVFAGIVVNIFYGCLPLLRYIVTAFIVIVCFAFRKKLMNVYRKTKA